MTDGWQGGIDEAVAGAEDWEDMAARLADWGLTATGRGGRITLRAARDGAVVGTCPRPERLGPAEAHFRG